MKVKPSQVYKSDFVGDAIKCGNCGEWSQCGKEIIEEQNHE